MPLGLLNNITAILGFGFLGLSAIMVILAFWNVQQVTAQDNPNQSNISLSRSFMKIALVFMIVSGPLQWMSTWINSFTRDNKVSIVVTMNHPDWNETFGDVILFRRGEKWPLVNKPYKSLFGNDDEIQINAANVISVIRDIRAQLTAATGADVRTASGRSSVGAASPINSAVTRNVLGGG